MSARPARRNRWGTFFLLLAAAGFVLFTFQPWWPADAVRYFRAFFEASLVGALADWFAVTALFRRPLGLPLPHTDVLVRRKDQLVEALPRFFAGFLEPAKIGPVLRNADWAGLILDRLEPEQLDSLFDRGLAALEESSGRDAWERKIVGAALALAHRELGRRQDELVDPMTALIKRNAGWKGLFVGRDTVDEAIGGFLGELEAMRDDPAHPLRLRLLAAFHEAWPRLTEELRPSRWTTGAWKQLADAPAFRADLNRRVGELAAVLWERSGAAEALAGGLRYLLAQTDARTLADRIEEAVRNDLQYIRVNGALVGGLSGLGLEALKSIT